MHNLHKAIKMDSLMPALFHEIYRKRFGMTYDVAQESTWHWLTAQHISDFYTPAYTRSDPPSPCITLREGHRPKMFLWMVEEYAFILCHLCRDDCNGFLVLGHELLLLACSQCCQKRGGGQGSCTAQAQLPWIDCPLAPFKPWSMLYEQQTLFS